MVRPLPKAYAYLAKEPGPKLLLEALKHHGVREIPGPGNSMQIMKWAMEVGAASYYKSDVTPWCALAMAAWVKAAGFAPPRDPLRALSWLKWGTEIRKGHAALGDVLVMERNGGGHVTLYIGETDTHYFGLGGNQNDEVCIAGFPKTRISAIRRCPWKVAEPANVRPILLSNNGLASLNARES